MARTTSTRLKATQRPRRAPAALRRALRGHQLRPNQPAHRPDVHAADGTQTVTGAQISDPAGRSPASDRSTASRAPTSNTGRSTTQHYTSFFVQDTLTVGNRLTIKPGIRYEQQKLVGTLVDDFTLERTTGRRASAPPTTSSATGGRSSSRTGAASSPRSRTISPRARCRPTPASAAPTTSTPHLTQPIPERRRIARRRQTTRTSCSISGSSAGAIDRPGRRSRPTSTSSSAGFEFEAFRELNLGVRYIHRTIPRVLEDVGSCPDRRVRLPAGVGCECRLHADEPGPGSRRRCIPDLGASFEKPIHDYDAVEFTADKRFSQQLGAAGVLPLVAAARHLRGLLPRRQRPVRPGITSLYRLPDQRSELHARSASPQFGYRGDIRFLGALGAGPLPLDRPHQVKLFGNYVVQLRAERRRGSDDELRQAADGAGREPELRQRRRNPATPRGAGIETIDGFKTRTPFEYTTRPARRLRVQVRRQQPARAAGRHVQPVRPAADDRLRQLRRARAGRGQP